MKKTVLLLISFGFYIIISAQVSDQNITEIDLQSLALGEPTLLRNIDALYEGVKGTPYFNEDFKTGDIYFPDGSKINQIAIRYNIYRDELEFKNSTSGKIFIIDKKRINGFKINDSGEDLHFEYFILKPDKPEEKVLIQVLYKGKTMLVLKHKKMFIKADYKGAYASGEKYDEFQDDKDYYLITDNDIVQKIRLNKRSVLKALDNNQSGLKEFSLNAKIDFSDPADVIKLLVFYDSQQTNR